MPERKSFLLRIEPGLHESLEAWAQQEMRSVNGQIEFILREAVRKRRGQAGDGAPAALPTPPASSDPATEPG